MRKIFEYFIHPPTCTVVFFIVAALGEHPDTVQAYLGLMTAVSERSCTLTY